LLKSPSVVIAERAKIPQHGDKKALVEALVRGGVVHIMGCENRWVSLARKHGLDESCLKVNVTTDNSISAIELTRAGFGPCLVQQYYAEPVLGPGDLIAPLEHGIEIEEAQYVLTPHSAQKKNPAVMLFRKWLLDEAAEYERGS
ncbi:MAG TPA: LysR substrate-binding domain-containing protein, partial [Paracoccaceae bacterium]|nr:LysR substrate-binding domain-containing protein [Paracoccaceae bacterium]